MAKVFPSIITPFIDLPMKLARCHQTSIPSKRPNNNKLWLKRHPYISDSNPIFQNPSGVIGGTYLYRCLETPS